MKNDALAKIFSLNDLQVKDSSVHFMRIFYLQKIKVQDIDGEMLDSIEILDNDEDDDSISSNSLSTISYKMSKDDFKYNPINVDKTIRDRIRKGMKRYGIEYFTKASFEENKNFRRKVNMSKSSLSQIYKYFDTKQKELDDNIDDDSLISPYFSSENEDANSTKSESTNDKEDFNNNESSHQNSENEEETEKSNSRKKRNNISSPNKRQKIVSNVSSLLSPKEHKGKKVMTPLSSSDDDGIVTRSKSKSSGKMLVHVSPVIKSKFQDKKFVLIVNTEYGKAKKDLFGWRPDYLPKVFKLFQSDYEEGEFLRKWKFGNIHRSASEYSSEHAEYNATILYIIVPLSNEMINELKANCDHISTEKDVLKECFEAFFQNMVKNEKFEERLVNAIDGNINNEKYPRKSYAKNSVVSYIARTKDDSEKKDNIKRIENVEIQYRWNVPVGKFVVKQEIKELLESEANFPVTKDNKNTIKLVTGFDYLDLDNDN